MNLSKSALPFFLLIVIFEACENDDMEVELDFPGARVAVAPAQAPEGIEYNRNDPSF